MSGLKVSSATKLKVLVTGAGGQLGQELMQLQLNDIQFVGWGREQLDITKADECEAAIGSLKPDIIIHTAAFTAVDQAESEPEKAWLVNVQGTRNVASSAEAVGAKFCYISTDYVFDGMNNKPYEEDDPPNPRTVYGSTKLEGELAAAASCSHVFIVRTSWIYGKYGHNFVHTMLKLAEQKRELTVVQDQTGSPTYARDLAIFLLELVRTDKYGTYHASNGGFCTWFDFANAIFEEKGLKEIKVIPCTTEQYPRPAKRPAYSVLGQTALVQAGLEPLRHWRDALKHFLADKVDNC